MNKDGHITSGELKTVMKKLGQNPSDDEVAEFIKVCDVDKNGTIEFNEFCRYLVETRRKVRFAISPHVCIYLACMLVCLQCVLPCHLWG